jgi:peptide/nickel transport system permease protein/oligopeptide transport system permease protein
VAIAGRDFAVVQAIVIYIAVLVVAVNFFVDILYQWLDPRVRLKQ